jgi:hypothetical protein
MVFPVGGDGPVHLVNDGVVQEHLGASKGVRHNRKNKGDGGGVDLTEEGGKRRRQ